MRTPLICFLIVCVALSVGCGGRSFRTETVYATEVDLAPVMADLGAAADRARPRRFHLCVAVDLDRLKEVWGPGQEWSNFRIRHQYGILRFATGAAAERLGEHIDRSDPAPLARFYGGLNVFALEGDPDLLCLQVLMDGPKEYRSMWSPLSDLPRVDLGPIEAYRLVVPLPADDDTAPPETTGD